MTEAYLTPEKMEAFVKEYRASKSQCWTCDQIVRKIEQKIIIGDSDRYHMVICRPKLQSTKNPEPKKGGENMSTPVPGAPKDPTAKKKPQAKSPAPAQNQPAQSQTPKPQVPAQPPKPQDPQNTDRK